MLAELLDGPERPLEVVAAAPAALHLGLGAVDGERRVGTDVVSVVARDAVALPTALVLPVGVTDARGLTLAVRRGVVGGGRLELELSGPPGAADRDARGTSIVLRPTRWWRAEVGLLATEGRALAARTKWVDALVADERRAPDPLVPDLAGRVAAIVGALAAGADAAAHARAGELLGLGRGFTPAGDDALAGLLVVGAVLRPAGAERAVAVLAGLAAHVVPLARARTGRVSATLLALAADGRVAPPVGRLLRALAGVSIGGSAVGSEGGIDGGNVEVGAKELAAATHAVLSLGHGSGRDLLVGIVAGVALLTDGPTDGRPSGPHVGLHEGRHTGRDTGPHSDLRAGSIAALAPGAAVRAPGGAMPDPVRVAPRTLASVASTTGPDPAGRDPAGPDPSGAGAGP